MLNPRFSLLLAAMSLSLAGCDSYPDISDSEQNQPDPSEASNDTFFGADSITEERPVLATLSSDNTIDHYKFTIFQDYNGPLTVTLSGITGDADIELYDFNLNLVSWSRTADTSEELIELWHDAAYNSDSYDNGQYFIRVYTRDAGLISDYTLEWDFDQGNAE